MIDARGKLVIPEHAAVITGGNGRWAKKRGVPRAMGHKAGCETLEKMIRVALDMGIQYLTIHGSSTENWKRSAEEVGALMQLMWCYLVRLLKITPQNNVKVEMLGEKSRFDKDTTKGIDNLVEGTKDNTGIRFIIAVNYGGRDEIVWVARKLVKECHDNGRDISEIDEAVFNSHPDTYGLLDPDLLIRTSGEIRLSNYLLWQLTYTELYVTDCLWSDFNKEELEKAVVAYSGREHKSSGRKQPKRGDLMFMTRLISGIILVLIAILVVSTGGSLPFAVTGAISLIGLFELYRVMKIEKNPLGLIGYLATISYYGPLWFDGEQYVTLMAIAVLMLLTTMYVFTFPKYKAEEITVAFFGIFYMAVMLSYLYQVREMPDGGLLVRLIFISSWGCDTCTYRMGVLLEKHKLTPVLSPKKTIEGAVGGMAGVALPGYFHVLLIGHKMMVVGNSRLAYAMARAITAVISQVGDLVTSAIKRNHEVKDYGHLIPGHGGILDRFDSVIFTALVIYLAVIFLARR